MAGHSYSQFESMRHSLSATRASDQEVSRRHGGMIYSNLEDQVRDFIDAGQMIPQHYLDALRDYRELKLLPEKDSSYQGPRADREEWQKEHPTNGREYFEKALSMPENQYAQWSAREFYETLSKKVERSVSQGEQPKQEVLALLEEFKDFAPVEELPEKELIEIAEEHNKRLKEERAQRDSNKTFKPYKKGMASERGVYVIRDEEDNVLYVGKTNVSFKVRFSQHVEQLENPDPDIDEHMPLYKGLRNLIAEGHQVFFYEFITLYEIWQTFAKNRNKSSLSDDELLKMFELMSIKMLRPRFNKLGNEWEYAKYSIEDVKQAMIDDVNNLSENSK